MGTMNLRTAPAGQRQRRLMVSRAALSSAELPLELVTSTALGMPLASTVTRRRTLPCALAARAEAG